MSKSAISLFVFLLAHAALCHAEFTGEQEDRKQLLDGVKEIAAPGWTGTVCVFGENAFVVVAGDSGGNTREPAVAASRLGKGRIVAFGHNGYFSKDAVTVGDTRRLMENALRWAAGKDRPRVAVQGAKDMVAVFQNSTASVQELSGPGWESRLGNVDVLVSADSSGYSHKQAAAVERMIRRGGAFLTAECPWGWQGLNPGKSLANDFGGNKVLVKAGLIWAGGGVQKTSPLGLAAEANLSPLVHATPALQVLLAQAEGKAMPSGEELTQASASVIKAARSLPMDDKILRPTLEEIQKTYSGKLLIEHRPLGVDHALERAVLAMDVRSLQQMPAEQVKAHPTAAVFPGPVPKDAPRVTKSMTMDTGVPNWHSTGLYAAPGGLIEVLVPAKAAKAGLRVRIGCHTDGIWDHDKWSRAPEISRSFAVDAAVTKAANAFGGLIYIEVPAGCTLGNVGVEIRGAVEAPHFVLGKTTPAEWQQAIRNRPAPWAELESDKVIITVPSESVRELNDPTAVMKFWSGVADTCNELLLRPAKRAYAERYVTDVQISNGYMHAGYPIMTLLDVAPLVVDVDKLVSQGSWGHFHEMGHNHQSPDWTFDGTVEVTCNLFTMYVYDKCCHAKESLFKPEEQRNKFAEYLAAGAKFENWKQDPFLALEMYYQLREAFGWETYQKVFAAYDRLSAGERPKTDEEKRDLWMVMFSRAVGKNLGPFFELWRVPTSETARASIKNLPVWMPKGFSKE